MLEWCLRCLLCSYTCCVYTSSLSQSFWFRAPNPMAKAPLLYRKPAGARRVKKPLPKAQRIAVTRAEVTHPDAWMPQALRRKSRSAKSRLMSGVARRRWEFQGFQLSLSGPAPTLTGRVLLAVRNAHVPHGQETRDGRLTIGACHLPLRTSAAPGDVVVLVSAPRGAASSNRGMLTRQRLVLLACVVDETLSVPRYYHASAPDWANKRRDRIYTVTQVGSKCHRRTTQRSFTEFLDQSDEAKLRGATAEKSGTKSWKVKYPSFPGTTAVFSRKGGHHTYPLHTTEGVNAIEDKVRVKDFQGRVLVSRRFALFPGVETETNALPFNDFRMKTKPGRGLRVTTLGKNRALRRWIGENLL